MAPGSVSHWLQALKNGDQAAAQPLWERYHTKLIDLARQKLPQSMRRQADEEDVVQNAFASFFQGMNGGRFPQLTDRHDLWRLLVVITARRAIDQVRRERRGGNHDVTPDALSTICIVEADDDAALEQIVGREPTPELAAQLLEQYERLLRDLKNRTLEHVAVLKLEGFNNSEIADKLGCSRRTVIRKLEVIRTIWSDEP